MKRKIALALTALLACSLIGCGGGNNSTQSTPDSSSDANKTVYASARVMSINIAGQDMTLSDNKYTVKYPGQTGDDYTYEKRRARLDVLISEYTPDVLFLQEVNGNDWWWPYLVSNEDSFLNTFTEYELVGRTNRVGGEDGAGKLWHDLYNQVYYDTTKFDSVATGMFYLNAKRTEPFSASWHESATYDSDDNNTCVWAVLKDKKTGVSALYASTHLKPTGGYLARAMTNYRQAIHLADGLYNLAEQYADEGGTLPIIVGGDFNLVINHEYNYAYPHLTEYAHYSDAQKIATVTDTNGTARVWGKNKVATAGDGSTTDGYRIDIFFTQGMNVSKYQCLDGVFLEDASGAYYTPERLLDGSAYDLSDHLPIMADVKIPSKDRVIQAPDAAYSNPVGATDNVVSGGESEITAQKMVFTADDIVEYFSVNQYMKAEVVSNEAYVGVLRLQATEACPNVFAYFDYDKLMQDKGLTPVDISGYSKIRITYKTSLTFPTSELMVGVLNEGDTKVNYGKNTVNLINNPTGYTTQTFDLPKQKTASGAITDLILGTMAYATDFSGVCGMAAGDCIYVRSIEFIA